jgi:hypothetical protein
VVDAPAVQALRGLPDLQPSSLVGGVAARHSEIAAGGVGEVLLFHSAPQELRTYAGGLTFDAAADRG